MKSLPGVIIIVAILVWSLYCDFTQGIELQTVKLLVLRGLCIIAVFSLSSFLSQAYGLIGDNGLFPISSSLKKIDTFLATVDDQSEEKNVYNNIITVTIQRPHASGFIGASHPVYI